MAARQRTERSVRVLVTGGPTRAYLDRVRFLSNFSTGNTAFKICKHLIDRGAQVAAVVGPTCEAFNTIGLAQLDEVETTSEMQASVLKVCKKFRPHFAVFAAAVLDYEPVKTLSDKRASSKGKWTIQLKPTVKIVDRVRRLYPAVRRIEFKLEWKRSSAKDPYTLALDLLEKKRLDMICVNFLSEIDGESHPASIFNREGEVSLTQTKDELAAVISTYILAEGG